MKRSKSDMLVTREQVLSSAFTSFYENGYEGTSLTKVAEMAGVTRGAVYWHFKDKKELYRAVADVALEKGDIAQYIKDFPSTMDLAEKIKKTFEMALGENRYVDFIFKTMVYTSGKEEFSDIYQKLRDLKRDLYNSLNTEIVVYMRMNGIKNLDSENYAMGLYLLFEGMFLTKNVPIGINVDNRQLELYVDNILEHLIKSK